MRKYLVEAIGTFFWVAVLGLTLIGIGAGALAPLTIGATVMAMVYAGKYISGGHYNPAVTLAAWMLGKCEKKNALLYVAAQIVGAMVAALVVGWMKQSSYVAAARPDIMRALICEFLFTFALCYVVLQTTLSQKTEGNSYFGLAIGLTVLVGAYAVGGISGGIFNPAVAIGVTIMGLSKFANIWIFLVGNFAGGALAAVTYKYVNSDGE